MQLIIGTGTLAKQSLNDIIEYDKSSIEELVFFDNINNIKEFYGYRVINSFDEINEEFSFVICILDSKIRKSFYEDLIKLGGKPRTLISKNSNVFFDSKKNIPEANLILPYTVIEPEVSIGIGNIINCYSLISNCSFIGNFNEIMSGSKILNNVIIGSNCRIGSNSVILNEIEICDNVYIEPGSVITGNIKKPGFYNSSGRISSY